MYVSFEYCDEAEEKCSSRAATSERRHRWQGAVENLDGLLFLSGSRSIDIECHHASTQIGWVHVETYHIKTVRIKDRDVASRTSPLPTFF